MADTAPTGAGAGSSTTAASPRWTVHSPTATAVAITAGRFTAVGSDEEVLALAGRGHTAHRPAGPVRCCRA